jgi:pimeloyl-ACP methyl ester carboxylesterase
VLLHGLGRTSWSMRKLERALSQRGFETENVSYPSRRLPLQRLARYVADEIGRRCPGESGLHFVTHSLGGIVLRYCLKMGLLSNVGRIVMLSPPNQGCELVDRFGGSVFFRLIAGAPGVQLGTAPSSLPNSLGPVGAEVGVIAGNRSVNPLLTALIPDENDGRISVERTQVEGMTDFVVLPSAHSLIVWNGEAIRQAIHFLEQGRFSD